ncbi:hypothetical protein SAMN05660489_04562 [Pseudomonas sp. LAMO17WK12:I10]|uniref:hypothetical protein n=1 Tax=unclassified Pseudomonas TaxID=196821 RepID=UPI000BC44023|nr:MULTISPECIES: hypothetical protein [unclassified Pseudomonas]PXX59537.1 hypothetical protein H160_04657 [Pseudomonas sp. LAMO17WK12:I9]SNY46777.1 hypothetical protein SAMN05660489_04562 [Pseudomonas sp. LAMO17WK12:I10]
MVARLVVTKDTGELLFDTSKICYGLVKSGNLAYLENWARYYLKSAQLDPSDGANWAPESDPARGDPAYGFTVTNALSPIVFITGPGCLNGVSRSGSSMTFIYINADANTKFYCFDLMADNIPGSPYLKTRLEDGRISFNSLQPPLNVLAAIQAPAPPAHPPAWPDWYGTTYVGGYNVQRRGMVSPNYSPALDSRVDIGLAGEEYAAYLPWSRSAICLNGDAQTGLTVTVSEGAYGRVGGISFMFGAAGATTIGNTPSGTGTPAGNNFRNIPTDRYPTALVIRTAGLPFPYQ